MEWDLIQWVTMVVGPAIGWLAARITRRVDSQKQLLDALDRQNKDIVKLYTEIGIIRRAVERRNMCRYINVCPVDYALRKSPMVDRKLHTNNRQYCPDEDADGETCDGSTVTGRPPPEFEGFKQPDTRGAFYRTKRTGSGFCGKKRQYRLCYGNL